MSDIVTGNYFDKYGSDNLLVRWVVDRYLETLYDLLDRHPFDAVLDAGCGEGAIVDRIIDRYGPRRLVGLDIDPTLVASLNRAHPTHEFRVGTLQDYQDPDAYDVVLCLEVLEHIPDYTAALAALARLSTLRLILSVPNEPFFRLANLARLRYLRRLGNTPGHVNNFTRRRFARILRDAFPDSTVTIRSSDIWTFGHIQRPVVF
jgi:2-polyprenyl-3-methyl-5-hydroxy-6-metoxy-1,4-benzoquinol methylase